METQAVRTKILIVDLSSSNSVGQSIVLIKRKSVVRVYPGGPDIGQLTQLVECHVYIVMVTGSSPVMPTKPKWWNWYTQQT